VRPWVEGVLRASRRQQQRAAESALALALVTGEGGGDTSLITYAKT
jgi:hypothetical protein